MTTYRQTRSGRFRAVAFILAAALLAGLSLWTLPSVLHFQYANLPTTLVDAVRNGVTAAQLVPAGLLIAMLVAAPFVAWAALEELGARYEVTNDRLIYTSVAGVVLSVPWQAIKSVRGTLPDAPVVDVVIEADVAKGIRNPFLRSLHGRAIGLNRIPIYDGVEKRDELVAEIVRRSGKDLGPTSGFSV